MGQKPGSLFARIARLAILCSCLFSLSGTGADNSTADPTGGKNPQDTGAIAARSVFRVLNRNYGGTGFLHKSGAVITAAHVVAGGDTNSIRILSPTMEMLTITNFIADTELDLAILKPTTPIAAPAFPLLYTNRIPVGLRVSAWGFPQGYAGQSPLLIVGYVAGKEYSPAGSNSLALRMVVNAAFNAGQSGSPLVQFDGDGILGVVVSRADPIPPKIVAEIQALKEANGGGFFAVTNVATGESTKISEGQLLGEVLDYLHSQTQTMIGHVVPSPTLARFLQRNGIEP